MLVLSLFMASSGESKGGGNGLVIRLLCFVASQVGWLLLHDSKGMVLMDCFCGHCGYSPEYPPLTWYRPCAQAGAYGIQSLGGCLVRRLQGDYFTVMGFPLCRYAPPLTRFVHATDKATWYASAASRGRLLLRGLSQDLVCVNSPSRMEVPSAILLHSVPRLHFGLI